jgi:hypothetical protein
LDPKEWSESVVAVIGGGKGGRGNQFTGTSSDVKNVKLAVDAARKVLEQYLGK